MLIERSNMTINYELIHYNRPHILVKDNTGY